MIRPRTDLALELTENLSKTEIEDGISIEIQWSEDHSIKETTICITNENGANVVGKPKGTYITIEGVDLSDPDEDFHKKFSRIFSETLNKMLQKYKHILAVGLGNALMTADSLGPLVIQNLYITRHLLKEGLIKDDDYRCISALVPGVMAQTGMESGEIIKGVTDHLKPDVILIIDALAAQNASRLNRTIQISNTGISPGSGVGNHRKEITKDTMGVEVIAVGVPTVISVPTIVNDALSLFDDHEDIHLENYIAPELAEMYVTPKNVDEAVKKISYTISEGINRIVHKPIS